MKHGVRHVLAVSLVAFCGSGLADESELGAKLGSDDFHPSPEHPVGWLGDLSARYPGAHDFPLEWNSTTGKNILWKTALPGWGHSSPIVVGNPSAGSGQGRVFLTCDLTVTVCIDAETGAILWQKSADSKLSKWSGIYHCATGYSMGTACSDGKNLFVTHYGGVVISYDFSGNVRWKKDVTPIGWSGASPVVVDGKFVVIQGVAKPGDNDSSKIRLGGPFDLVAYSCETGEVVWRNTGVVKMSGWHYNGLVPVWVGGDPYLVNYLGQFFNARDGRLVAQLFEKGPLQWVPAVQGDAVVFVLQLSSPSEWRSGMLDLAKVDLPVPAGMAEAMQRDKTLVNKGGIPREKWKGFHGQHDNLIVPVKIAADGKGGLRFEARQKPIVVYGHSCDVTHTVLVDDILYFVGDGNHSKPGMAVFDLRTGLPLNSGGYDGMEIKPSLASVNGPCGGSSIIYSHSVVAGDYFVLSDWGGRTHVFNRAPDFREVAENLTTTLDKPKSGNPIGGPAGGLESSFFFHGKRIYVRFFDVLYCIGDPKAAENATAFAAAKAHFDAGRIQQALQSYHQLWNAEPLHVRYRAVREMGTVLGAQAIDEFSQTFRHSDTNLRALAVSVVARIPGDAVARRLAEGLSDGDPAYRCQVLEALGQRGDRSASPQLVLALDDKTTEVRQAAISAARRIGGTVVVQGIVERLERFSEPERRAATAAMIAMPEPDTEMTLAELVPRAPPLSRSILLHVLGNRGSVAQTALVMGETGHADRSVRLAALGALTMVAGAKDLDQIVARMKQAKDDEERRAIEGALSGVFNRERTPEVYSAALIRGLPSVDGPGFATLIRALGQAGGKAPLAEVRKALENKDAVIHAAAIEALAAWPDTATEPDLMAVAKTERNATNLAVVARGLLAMLDLSPRRPETEIFAVYAQAMKTGQARDSIVAHLACQKDVRAIEMAASLLERKDLEDSIVNTITLVAPTAAEKDPARTISALNKASEGVSDSKQKDLLNATIKDLVAKYGSKALDIPMGGDLGL